MSLQDYSNDELLEEIHNRGIEFKVKIKSVEVEFYIGDREYDITAK